MTGVSRFIYHDSAIDLTRTIVAAPMDSLYERANQALAEFDAIAKKMGVLSYEKRLVDDEPEGGVTMTVLKR
jgi:hypothetical protein